MGVYCLMTEDKSSVKVGYTGSISKLINRIKSLQTACPFKLLLIGYDDKLGLNHEKQIHAKLNACRTLNGGTEWFSSNSLQVIEGFLELHLKNAIPANKIKERIVGRYVLFEQSDGSEGEECINRVLAELGIDVDLEPEDDGECEIISSDTNFCPILRKPLAEILYECGIYHKDHLNFLDFKKDDTFVSSFFYESKPANGFDLLTNLLAGTGYELFCNSQIACKAVVFSLLEKLRNVNARIFSSLEITWVVLNLKTEIAVSFIEDHLSWFSDIFEYYGSRLLFMVTEDFRIIHKVNLFLEMDIETKVHKTAPIAYYH